MTSRQRWFSTVSAHTCLKRKKWFKDVFVEPFFGGGESAQTPWSWGIAVGSGPPSRVQGPLFDLINGAGSWGSRWDGGSVPGLEVQMWLTCWHPKESRSAQRSSAWVQMWFSSSICFVALMAFQIFPNTFPSSPWVLDHGHFLGLLWSSWLRIPGLGRPPHGSSTRAARHRKILHGPEQASAQCAPFLSYASANNRWCRPLVWNLLVLHLVVLFPQGKNVTSKKKGKHAWACAGIASAFAARFPHGISCRNSADLDFSGLVGSFQSGLSQKRACFNFTFFCGIDELPNVQVLCCVKELLEQFVLELRLDGKQSYHLLMHPFIRHSIAHGCQLRFYEPPLSPCNNLFFPAWVCVGAWL